MKGRDLVIEIESAKYWKLPDHHSKKGLGFAYWFEEDILVKDFINVTNIKEIE